jgi:hypothetical protein
MNALEQDGVTGALDAIIRAVAPDVSLVPKYGGTLYTLWPEQKEGQFCGIFPYKAHVQLAFSEGAMLADPDRVLEGTGKFRRHVNFTAVSEIDEGVIAALLKEAVMRSRGGKGIVS